LAVEINSETFLEIFETFINACYNNYPEYRISALYTIGYLFDEIDPKFLSNDTIRKFLMPILSNIDKKYENVLRISLYSFMKILPYLKNLFKYIEIKEQIMQKIYELIDQENIYSELLLILCEISKKNYIDLNENDFTIIEAISRKSVKNNIIYLILFLYL
jgi:hypothetical protein